jgi:hypothetical protein
LRPRRKNSTLSSFAMLSAGVATFMMGKLPAQRIHRNTK